MLTQPENTIKLSDEQTLAIEETKNRLANMEAEISIATKNFKTIKQDTEKAIKERAYEEERLSSIVNQIKPLEDKKVELESAIIEKIAELGKINSDIKESVVKQEEKEKELNDREELVVKNDKYLSERKEILDNKEIEIKDQTDSFNSKISKLKEVISEF